MKVIDPHVHFWDIARHRYPWMLNTTENFSGDMRAIKKNYLVENLLQDAQDIDILKVVHIEANIDPADPVAETRWLQELAQAPSHRNLPNAIVAQVDLSQTASHVERILEQHCAYANMRGIRQILNVHPNAFYDYVGREYMVEPQWQRNFHLLAKYQLSFDLQIYPSQMMQAAQLAQRHPETTIIINHAGMFVDRHEVAGWRQWRDGLAQLARCSNTSIKISGMGMLDHHWTVESIRPYVLQIMDTFGVERCMFASNFPVDKLYSSYSAVWQAYANVVRDASSVDKEALFVGNAQRIYRI